MMILGQYGAVLVGTLWYWVSIWQYGLIYDVTGLVWSGTDWYMIILGQLKSVEVSIWWCLVSIGRYWLVLGGTGSIWGSAGWYSVVLVYIWWYWVSIGLYACIYWKKVEIWSDVTIAGRQTNKRRTRKDRANQPIDQGRLRWAKTDLTCSFGLQVPQTRWPFPHW